MSGKRIIFFGAPGSGKGTQSEILQSEYNLAHLSTGDMLRAEIKTGTPLGLRVKDIIEAGNLVDDSTIMEIVKDVITTTEGMNGFIFDGIPRTLNQAVKLDELMEELGKPITSVLYLNVSREELKERICGRLFHPSSGRTYHRSFNPPKVAMTDDVTGEPLIVRKDDTEEVFEQRMNQYDETFAPVLEYYRQKGILVEVIGTGKTIQAIAAEIKEHL